MPRDRILCVMAPTQSSNSSFSWSTLKEARKRLFFCARRKPANDIQQMRMALNRQAGAAFCQNMANLAGHAHA